jgi:hypothetical protein
VYVGLPVIPDDAPEDVKNALAIHNSASVDGVCPACGATPIIHLDPRTPGLGVMSFLHANDCPVTELLEGDA